jgi:Flp pilus assembly protein TadG
MFMIACRRVRRRADKERGQVILEFLGVMVLLLTLAFAAVEFGYLIWENQVIVNLSREGSNLAARNTNLITAVNAVISDGAMLNLSTNGKVIITAIQNKGTPATPHFVITNQSSAGGLGATSVYGVYNGSGTQVVNNLTQYSVTIPQPGSSIFVTEVYCSYTAITPLGAFMSYTVPTTLHDVAYF